MEYTPLHHSYDANREDEYASYPGITTPVENVDFSDVEYLFAGKSDDEVAAIKQSVYEERQFMHEQWLSRNADKFNIPSGKNILDEFLKEHGIEDI